MNGKSPKNSAEGDLDGDGASISFAASLSSPSPMFQGIITRQTRCLVVAHPNHDEGHYIQQYGAVKPNQNTADALSQVIECFGTGENTRGGDGDGCGATAAAIFEGLGFGSPIVDEKRSRAVTDVFRELDEDGSGIIREGNLRRRYDTAAATAPGEAG